MMQRPQDGSMTLAFAEQDSIMAVRSCEYSLM
jgi:hypothetical protein